MIKTLVFLAIWLFGCFVFAFIAVTFQLSLFTSFIFGVLWGLIVNALYERANKGS